MSSYGLAVLTEPGEEGRARLTVHFCTISGAKDEGAAGELSTFALKQVNGAGSDRSNCPKIELSYFRPKSRKSFEILSFWFLT
jgi:hypothetical protein